MGRDGAAGRWHRSRLQLVIATGLLAAPMCLVLVSAIGFAFADGGPTVSAAISPVSAGAAQSATWSGIASPTPGDFIGLYPSSATANNAYLAFKPTTGTASGSVQITVPSGAVPGSTYELRLFANNSYTRLATSAPFTVAAATLTESPSPASAGAPLTATWSGVAPATAGDFIGLYPSSATANSAYLTFKPTTGAGSGSVQITVPAGATPGSTYELRLFSNNTYSRMATSAPFTVQAANLSETPSPVSAGAKLTANWSGVASPTAGDFIGLYPSGAAANNAYLAFKPTTGTASGSVQMTVPSSAAPGSAYELRLFANNSYTRLATSSPFSVAAAALSASPSPVNAGTALTASWSNVAPATAGDFIGLYPSSATANNAYIAFKPTTGTASGSVQITVPSSAVAGTTYELRLFANNTYSRMATSASFIVQPKVSATISPVSGGAQETATWAGIASPTPGDFIALYPSSATANNAYLAFKPTTGTASGSVQITVPSGAVPGSTYELRLFANNSYTRLATSAPFTVAAATLTESPSPASVATALTASWSNVAPATAGDFIGLYPSSATANNAYIAFKPTTGT